MQVRTGFAAIVLVAMAAGPTRSAPKDPHAEEREKMRTALDQVLARNPLQSARVGVHVVSLDSGEVVYAHDADELLNPASNVKLVTSATALARLGPEYRFTTDFACSEPLAKGGCTTLYIKGRGDPSLYTERIYGIAGELMHRGLRRVGDIVVDDSYFDTEREGPGWEQERTDKPYLSPAGALSVNHNAVAIFVGPGESDKGKARVELEPASDYFTVENNVQMAPKKSRGHIAPRSIGAGEKQRIVVQGRIPPGRVTSVFYKRIDNPPFYAGETFKAIFLQRGITVKGKVRRGTVPSDASVLFTSYSPALAEIVRELNKVSNNFVAEQLLKSTGAEVKGTPGTWAKGVQAVEEYLAELGIPKGSYVMKNGSGLNDTNRFSASQITRLLAAVQNQSGFFPEYASSLGIAARDGTVRSRMEGTAAAGRLRGKTGTLENVTALSGYVKLQSGENYAYSIMVNDFATRHGPAIAAVDAIGAQLATGGLLAREPDPTPLVDSPGELRARVATFANLGRLEDKRNLPFLRSALRTERDPVLRAVIADAIYRSDNEAGIAQLLELFPLPAETFAKLRAVGQELSIPTPVLASLIDIAADGNGDAIDRLLALVPQLRDEEGTSATVADALQEIGRNAPADLLEGLRRSGEDAAEASIALLERGISATDEKAAHPFLERLRQPESPARTRFSARTLADRIEKDLVELAQKQAQSANPTPAADAPPAPATAPTTDAPTTPGGG